MKVFKSKRWLALGLAVCLAMPPVAYATNGYFLIGFGAKSRGMGGVGVAHAQDGLAAAFNPASMAAVDVSTMRVDIGGDLFNPPRAIRLESSTLTSYPNPDHDPGDPDSPATLNYAEIESGANLFLIPNMGGLYRFNRDITVGMAAIGAGLGTRYDQSVPGVPECKDGNTTGGTYSYFFNFNCLGSSTTGVMLMQMQMLPSVAYNINKQHTIGVSMAIALQMFRAYGLQAFDRLGFGSSGGGGLTNEGNDWSYGGGIRLGYHGRFLDGRLKLGANWASRVYMTEFDKYDNLFAEQGDFDIPQHYAVGLSYAVTPAVNVAFDVQHVEWSSIKSVGNKGPDAANPDQFFDPSCVVDPDTLEISSDCLLGGDRGLGFGWVDRTIYKLGVDYKYSDNWTFRAGLNYMKHPIPREEVLFTLLAPATVEKHITLGATYSLNPNMELTFSYVHAFENTVKGPTVFGPAGNAPVIGSNAAATMYQHAFGVSFGFKM